MKIVDIKTFPMSYVDHRGRQLNYLLLRVDTDSGIRGWGEVCDGYGCSNPVSTAEIIREALRPLVIGEAPEDVERIELKMRGWTRRRLGDSGIIIQAISGVEIALWDIAAKAAGVPVSALLGGKRRDAVRVYASGPFLEEGDPSWHAHFFAECFQQGVEAIKVRTGLSFRQDIITLSGLRRIVGDGIGIGVDGSEHYSLPSALALAGMLADQGVTFFEEPVPQVNLQGMAKMVERSLVPIAYGEHCYTTYGFRELITHKATDILQPDASTAGGILEARKICELADAFGMMVMPHCAAGPIALAANLHLCAGLPNLLMLEYPFTLDPFWREVLVEPMFSIARLDCGRLSVPAGVGLGIQLNEEAFERFPYRPSGTISDMPTWHQGFV